MRAKESGRALRAVPTLTTIKPSREWGTRIVPLRVGKLVVVGVADDGVVAFAGLDRGTFAAVDVDFAELAIGCLIDGSVADEVLGAEFVLDLVEGGFELFAVVAYVDDAAAGVLG